MSDKTVWLDGAFLPESRARVPATSNAVLQGVGLYETLRVIRGAAPLLDRHLRRFRAGAQALGIPLVEPDWSAVLRELTARNELADGAVRFTLAEDFLLAAARPLPPDLASQRQAGVRLTTAALERTHASLKGTARADLWHAERLAGGEVALLSRGRLLETSRANLFVVHADGHLETAPTTHVLPGVARGLVLELARTHGLTVRQRTPRWSERAAWRELFATSSTRGVRPVVQLDDQPFPVPGASSPTRTLQKALDEQMGLA